MGKVIKLTEADLEKIVKRVIEEQEIPLQKHIINICKNSPRDMHSNDALF